MHDFNLANEIVQIAKEHVQKSGLSKISKIVVELGSIIEHGENISVQNLKYNINLLMPCQVKIKKINGDTWRLVTMEGE